MLNDMVAGDIEELTALAEEFMEESGLGVTPDVKRIYDTLELVLNNEGLYCRIYRTSTNHIAGFYLAVKDWAFYKKPWFIIQEFYVDPIHRGMGYGVAGHLVADFLQIAEKEGCSHAFAASTARISPEMDDKFVGLFKKYGFDILGPTLVRDME